MKWNIHCTIILASLIICFGLFNINRRPTVRQLGPDLSLFAERVVDAVGNLEVRMSGTAGPFLKGAYRNVDIKHVGLNRKDESVKVRLSYTVKSDHTSQTAKKADIIFKHDGYGLYVGEMISDGRNHYIEITTN